MKKKRILIKYGGNAMTSDELKKEIAAIITQISKAGVEVVLVHGGGPFINKALEAAGIVSEFFDGQRHTTAEALVHIEKALKGEVNSTLVGLLNRTGLRAVGLSGKDGLMVTAEKRWHTRIGDGNQVGNADENAGGKEGEIEDDNKGGNGDDNGGVTESGIEGGNKSGNGDDNAGEKEVRIDLGQVGNVISVDPLLINLMLSNGYIPVIACIASDAAGNDYNINADMLAGHIAAALTVDQYIVLTDVDGLFRNFPDPGSLIREIGLSELPRLYRDVVRGGMIPKVQSCEIALKGGVGRAVMLNGTKPAQIRELVLENGTPGTVILIK
ncbi:MAG: acetylglutamate kinase [Cyclonatronaceae bacterium]